MPTGFLRLGAVVRGDEIEFRIQNRPVGGYPLERGRGGGETGVQDMAWMVGVLLLYSLTGLNPAARGAIFAMMLAGGFVMGYVFNTVAQTEEQQYLSAEIVAARTYAFDLWGASVGGLVSASLAIPLLGPTFTVAGAMALLAGMGIYANIKKSN